MSDSVLPAITAEKQVFIERLAQYYESFGIPRIAGRMFGLFLSTSQPLSAEQIADLLDASLSSVSTNIRAVIANGWVEKVTSPGDRTTYYRLSPNAWLQVMERRRQAMQPLKDLASGLLAHLNPSDPAKSQVETMVSWSSTLMTHYDQLIAQWDSEER